MVSGKPKYKNSYQGELRGQLGVMCVIRIMVSILGSTTLLFNSCNNISALRRATIHPEAVKYRWKQVDLISRLYYVYQSMDSGMSLVHIYGHQNSGRLASTLTSLASLNVRLDAPAEHRLNVIHDSTMFSNARNGSRCGDSIRRQSTAPHSQL